MPIHISNQYIKWNLMLFILFDNILKKKCHCNVHACVCMCYTYTNVYPHAYTCTRNAYIRRYIYMTIRHRPKAQERNATSTPVASTNTDTMISVHLAPIIPMPAFFFQGLKTKYSFVATTLGPHITLFLASYLQRAHTFN